jgi:Ser/Thr protein kinase RdoA (MazF antagonist)
MFLTEANVLHYLVEHRFADPGAVVDGQFAVRNLSRRNHNFRVTCGSREYLVKQAKQWTEPGRASIDTEASFYSHVRTDARFESMRSLLPESYGYDPDHSILILQFIPGQIANQSEPDRFSVPAARLVATAMAHVHREFRWPELTALVPPGIPSLFTFHEEDPDKLSESSEGQRELLRLIRKRPAFGHALEALRAEWREESLIHGDWKLGNCLVSTGGERIRMVDWEFVAWGDPLYDAATMLQSYWSSWVLTPAEHPVKEVRPALTAFLKTYSACAGAPLAEIVLPAIRLAGARMVQSAYEAVQNSDSLNASAVRLAQASLNILTRPEWAAEQLLGMVACAAN